MNSKSKKSFFFLLFLVSILLAINYSFFDSHLNNLLKDYEFKDVERVIDGDTLIADGKKIRLLGINAPEKGENYYEESKNFLEDMVLNKTIVLEYGSRKHDKYGRVLAYVFLDNVNINSLLVKKGLANPYYPLGKDLYYTEVYFAWIKCLESNQNLCQRSIAECSKCIKLYSVNLKEQEIVFYNQCQTDCNITGWIVRDEGRNKFIFPEYVLKKNSELVLKVGNFSNSLDNKNIFYWNRNSRVWSKSDSVFLRDSAGNLVLWKKL